VVQTRAAHGIAANAVGEVERRPPRGQRRRTTDLSGERTGAIALAFALALTPVSRPAFATENGGQNYPFGVNTILPGIAPPPGTTWWQNYSVYYSADRFNDGDGNALVPGFKLDAAAYAPRLFHSWNVKLGPFGLASAIVVPFVYVGSKTPALSSSDFNVGNPTLQPLYLTYANESKTFFAYGGIDFFAPTYTEVSRPYWSMDPIITMTWFPAKGVDVNMIALIEHALGENTSTNYRSGTLAVIDYSAHVKPFASLPKLSLGFNGYYLDQFTSDERNGVDIGFEGRAAAIGPELVYETGDAAGFAIKWQHEFHVRNRPMGEQVWFQFQMPLGK
jgi:hypothetical protein